MIEDYYNKVKEDFKQIIGEEKRAQTYNEKKIHDFIDKNPTCLLSLVMNNQVDGYSIYGSSIFSKISIGSWEKRVPDFIIITYNSVSITFNLIEIEAPNRKIFTEQNDFTADFNHSLTQLEDWKRLFTNNSNGMEKKMVIDCFSDMGIHNGARAINSKYFLVYGSSEEYNNHETKTKRLNQKFDNASFYYSSYDRLLRNFVNERGIYTLKYNSESGLFKAIGWTPYLKYSVDRRKYFGKIENKENLVKTSNYHNEEQKEELIASIRKLDREPINKLNDEYNGTDIFDDSDQ